MAKDVFEHPVGDFASLFDRAIAVKLGNQDWVKQWILHFEFRLNWFATLETVRHLTPHLQQIVPEILSRLFPLTRNEFRIFLHLHWPLRFLWVTDDLWRRLHEVLELIETGLSLVHGFHLRVLHILHVVHVLHVVHWLHRLIGVELDRNDWRSDPIVVPA